MENDITDRAQKAEPILRGTNQSAMRAQNERLVLSLLRSHGALAKSDIARATGLSAQTVSVIMRALEEDGLIARGAPVRGKIGQPSVPMSLAADGAFFLGLKVGRRSTDLVLADFLGAVRAKRREVTLAPSPSSVLAFVRRELPNLLKELTPAEARRVMGLGIAMPFQLWAWPEHITEDQADIADMADWHNTDLSEKLSALTGLPTYMQNDATAACGAEMIFGKGEQPRDSLYFYLGYFIGGGLVLNGGLFLGRTGNAGGVASIPVRMEGRTGQLVEVASLATLAQSLEAAGYSSEPLWRQPEGWDLPEPVLGDWLDRTAAALAEASVTACALLELEAVTLEGWLPRAILEELTKRTEAALRQLNLAGITPPLVRQGTVGPYARALGAAAAPLAQKYLLPNPTPLQSARDG